MGAGASVGVGAGVTVLHLIEMAGDGGIDTGLDGGK